MRKLLIALAFAGVSLSSMAQEDPTLKYSVATNSFWSNWFVQVGAQYDIYLGGQERKYQLFKSHHTNPGAAVAIGKWFTPGIGVRAKVNGIWGKSWVSYTKEEGSFKYWNVQFQPIFNLSNLLCGYNPNRVYNLSLFGGGGFARNMTNNNYAMGLSVGLLNQFYISKKVAINLELGWNRLENDFDGIWLTAAPDEMKSYRGWDTHDNLLYGEIGLTFNLGKSTWEKTPDVDAIKALSQSQIDALKAQLADANAENDRLKNMLANQPKAEVPQSVKEFVNAPVSVFFNLDKYEIHQLKDLVNVQALAKYAKENNSNLLVTGYADSATGTPDHNQWLSEKRAKRVADEIVKMGVSESKIKQEAKGGVDILSPISYNRRATVQITE